MEVCQYDSSGSESMSKQRHQKIDQLRLQKKNHDQLEKQTQLISDLTKSNAALREELAKADNTSFSASKQGKVMKLQAELDEIEMKIAYERMNKTDVQAKYINIREVIAKTRKDMSNTNTIYEVTISTEKQINVLNNRLEHALRKFNEVLTDSKSLRAQIDSLKGERRVFQNIYKRIEADLTERKLAMAEKIESANTDYEERDKLKQELDARKQIAEEDIKLWQESFVQLDKVLDQLKQTSQEQKRQQMASITLKTASNSTSKYNVTNNEVDVVTSPSVSRLRGKTNTIRSFGNTYSDRCGTETSRENDEEMDLQTVIDDIKTLTGHHDLRLLHDNFIKAEQTNFSLYNYVNTLNAQEEELEHEIAKLREEYGGKGDLERRTELKALENEIAAVELQQERLESESANHRHVLAEVRKSTHEIFLKIGCDKEEAVTIYGTEEVNDSNVAGFLGMIEQRINELLFVYTDSNMNKDHSKSDEDDEESTPFASDGDTDTKKSFIGIGPTTKVAAVTAPKIVEHISLPSTNAGDDKSPPEDITSGKEEILSHEEMRQRVEHRIQRRIERMENRGKTPTQKKVKK